MERATMRIGLASIVCNMPAIFFPERISAGHIAIPGGNESGAMNTAPPVRQNGQHGTELSFIVR